MVYGALVIWRARNLPAAVHADRPSPLRLLLDLGPLLALVVSVLGSIIAGLATPTEASGLGAFGALLITVFYGRFSTAMLMKAARQTVVTTSPRPVRDDRRHCFSAVFKAIGGDELVKAGITAFGTEPFVVLAVVMGAIFLLGFVLDWLEITLILVPIFAPIVAGLDFGNGLSGDALLVWFGILVAVNLQTSFLTPPSAFHCSICAARSATRFRHLKSTAASCPSLPCNCWCWRC